MRIGVVPKRGSVHAAAIARELLVFGEELGVEMVVSREVADEVRWDKTFVVGVDDVDYIVVVGGDGTLLRLLHRLGDSDTPVMTVRMGRRGFLLDVPPFEAKARLRDLVEGRFVVEEYMRISARIEGRGLELPPALNDVVVSSWGPTKTKVVRLVVYRDDDPVYSVEGDGVVIATPVGSTAYSLAAGGPIVDSGLEAILVTPLAPMQPALRPVVLSADSVVRVRVGSDSGPAACVVDGQVVEVLRPGDIVAVSKASKPARIVRFTRTPTYARLRQVWI